MVTFLLTVLFVIYFMPFADCRMSNFRFNPPSINDVFACIFTENSSASHWVIPMEAFEEVVPKKH
jgi:hypothetical protein